MKIAPINVDKKGEKWIETGGVHEDRAYIVRHRGNFVLTEPFDGGGMTFSGYSADWRVYDLRIKKGEDQARMLAEFEEKKDALEYFDWITRKPR